MQYNKKYTKILVTCGIISFFILHIYFIGFASSKSSPHRASKLSADAEIPIKVKNRICEVNYNDDRHHLNRHNLTWIYYVTPTYPRPEQIPELTRLSHTLMHVPRIHWIVADDQKQCSPTVLKVLRKAGVPYTFIYSPKPFEYHTNNYPRGVANRLAAITWLRNTSKKGVMYFGDDDNSVDLELFNEIRKTKKVSMFPVGLIAEYGVSSPIVKDGKVTAFFDSWSGYRQFPIDMAGFAVNLDHLTPETSMPYIVGHEEDGFLVSLHLKMDEIEPLAANCSKILVWHTRAEKYKRPTLKVDISKFRDAKLTNFADLIIQTHEMGMARVDSKNGIVPLAIVNRTKYTLDELP